MERLRTQLDELEQYAHEVCVCGRERERVCVCVCVSAVYLTAIQDHVITTCPCPSHTPTSPPPPCPQASENQPEGSALSGSLAEKQQIIIDGLRRRFDLQFGDLEQLR